MSDLGDTFRVWNEHKKIKKESNLTSSIEILKEKNVNFKVLNDLNGHIRIDHNGHRFNFWPSTGLFSDVKNQAKGRGVFNLLRRIARPI